MYPICQGACWESKRGKPLRSAHQALSHCRCSLFILPWKKNKMAGLTHDFLVNVLCCMCIMEALGGGGLLTQPTLFMCPHHRCWTKSSRWQHSGSQKTRVMWRAARLQADTRCERIFLQYHTALLQDLFIWVSRREDGDPLCANCEHTGLCYRQIVGWYLKKKFKYDPQWFHYSTHIFKVVNIYFPCRVCHTYIEARHLNHDSTCLLHYFVHIFHVI